MFSLDISLHESNKKIVAQLFISLFIFLAEQNVYNEMSLLIPKEIDMRQSLGILCARWPVSARESARWTAVRDTRIFLTRFLSDKRGRVVDQKDLSSVPTRLGAQVAA